MTLNSFRCFQVTAKDGDQIQSGLIEITESMLPEGDLLVRVVDSAINYKDALSAQAHPGISPNLPHVPGIDAVGKVVQCESDQFKPGDWVIIAGHEFGSTQWGAWAEYCRVPSDWAVSLPEGLSPRDAVLLGTAGFTAAQCVEALLEQKLKPDDGPIVVTGATGGVGTTAIMLLDRLGFEVIAVTGKASSAEFLRKCGAKHVETREQWSVPKNKPLLSKRCAGGIDTVGGEILTTLLRSVGYNGAVAACGLAASPELDMTVYPFILRGVRLIGIDSAWCSKETRIEIWKKLASDWKLEALEQLAVDIDLSEVKSKVEQMLAGQTTGRTIVHVSAADES